jgi:hypothetical protein
LFGLGEPDVRLGKAVYWVSTSTHVIWDFLKFLIIYISFPSPSNDVGFTPSLSPVTWTISVPSVSQATVPTILTLPSSLFWLSPAKTVPSAFPSISLPSISPVTQLLLSSQDIPDQSRFLAVEETFFTSVSLAFPVKFVHIQFMNILSSTEILVISEYLKSGKFMAYQTTLLHTSYSLTLRCLSIILPTESQVYFALQVSLTILGSNSLVSFLLPQLYPAKVVHVDYFKISVCTSIARSYDIASFIAMDRREDGMGVRIVWLVDDLIIPKACEFPEQSPLNTPDFSGGVPVSNNGHQSITNCAVLATELHRDHLGLPALNLALYLWSVPEMNFFCSSTSDSATIIAFKVWCNALVTEPDSIEDMEQNIMDRICYDSVVFIKCSREQLVKVYDRFGYRKVFDDSTAQLVAEIQVLAPPALPLYERSPIYADTRLVRELLTGRLNMEFRSISLDISEKYVIPDLFARHMLSGYISLTDDKPDDNLIKIVGINGPLNQALKKAIYGTHSDIVNYNNFFGHTIDDLERLPKTLSLSTWLSEIEALKHKSRNVSISRKPDGALSIDSLRGSQRLPDGFSHILSRQIFQRRREHLTWFSLYPSLKTNFIKLKESRVNKIFDKIVSEFERFSVITGNPRHDQDISDMLGRYVSVTQDGFRALGNWIILSASQLPKVLHPSRILQLWDIISVSSYDKDIKGAVGTLTPGDIFCVERTDLGPVSLTYTLSHEDSHTFHLSLMDLSRMGSSLATWLLGVIRDKLGAGVNNLGNMSLWIAGGQKLSTVEDFSRRFSGSLGTRLTGLIGAIDREAWINVDLPMIGVADEPNPEFDDFVASLISGGLET